jgi:uncharacterized protein (TIGR00369 family)
MSMPTRSGPFWDMMEGRAPAPPAGALLGWKLIALDPDAGTIRVQFTARPDFVNPVGTVQGGLLTAMLDDTMGPAATAYMGGGYLAQTLELKTCFLRAARPGLLFGDGRVVHRGRDILFLEGTLSNPEGKPVATATATARAIDFGKKL